MTNTRLTLHDPEVAARYLDVAPTQWLRENGPAIVAHCASR